MFGKGSITLGAAIHQAGVTLYDQSGDTYRNPLQTYTLFGDPALMMPNPTKLTGKSHFT